jgi:hypothetical protein
MLSADEKPSILEHLGAALNSGDLTPREGKLSHVDLIAALGQMQANPDAIEHEAKIGDAATLGEVIDPRAELAVVLLRLKYGGDRGLGERATRLLARWIRHQRAYGKWKLRPGAGDGMLEKFARLALAEWLFPVCPTCEGRKVLGLDAGHVVSKRIRCKACKGFGELKVKSGNSKALLRRSCYGCGGSGWRSMQRTVTGAPKTCYSCIGTGLRRDADTERAMSLGLEERVYLRHWQRRFSWIAGALDKLDGLGKRYLQVQTRERIKPL